MKVYYKIPDSDNEMQNKMLGMLYENFKLRIELAVASIEVITSKENGCIIVERLEHEVDVRLEGWTPETEIIIRAVLSTMRDKQRIKY